MLSLIGAAAAVTVAQAPDPVPLQRHPVLRRGARPFLQRLRASRRDSGQPVPHRPDRRPPHCRRQYHQWLAHPAAGRYGVGGRGVLAAGRPMPAISPGASPLADRGLERRVDLRRPLSAGRSRARDFGLHPDRERARPADRSHRRFARPIFRPGHPVRRRPARRRHDRAAHGGRGTALEPRCPTPPAGLPCRRQRRAGRRRLGDHRGCGPGQHHLVGHLPAARRRILSNLGVVGPTHPFRPRRRRVVGPSSPLPADLIVLRSPNEGSPRRRARVTKPCARPDRAIRRLAGASVPILLVGPPDAATRNAGIADPARACGDGWFVPRALGQIRERQMLVARQMRAGFWNWAAAMGGRCASHQWRLAEQMRGDHFHFTRSGGARIVR